MSSANKTANYGLSQWVSTDPFVLEDFNADNAKIDAAINAARKTADAAFISAAVYPETSTSQITRAVTIDGVTSWDDILNVPIYIKAAAYGTSSAATLSVNGLEAKSLYFPNMSGSGVTTTPQYYWVRTGQVYCAVWTGTYLIVTNMQVRNATTGYYGLTMLYDGVASDSTVYAATPKSVKTAYDKAVEAANATPVFGTVTHVQGGTATVELGFAPSALYIGWAYSTDIYPGSFRSNLGIGTSYYFYIQHGRQNNDCSLIIPTSTGFTHSGFYSTGALTHYIAWR